MLSQLCGRAITQDIQPLVDLALDVHPPTVHHALPISDRGDRFSSSQTWQPTAALATSTTRENNFRARDVERARIPSPHRHMSDIRSTCGGRILAGRGR